MGKMLFATARLINKLPYALGPVSCRDSRLPIRLHIIS
jgi:hypothetical protein